MTTMPMPVEHNLSFVESGLIEIFGKEYLESEAGKTGGESSWPVWKQGCVQRFGEQAVNGMILRAGRAAFYYWMRQNMTALGWKETQFRLLPPQARIEQSLTDFLSWFEQEKLLEAHLSSTPQAWQISVTGQAGAAKQLECKYLLGMVQELVCWAGAGKFYPARECRCRGEGHPDCLFEIQRRPAG